MKKLYLAFFVLLCSASFVIFMMEEKQQLATLNSYIESLNNIHFTTPRGEDLTQSSKEKTILINSPKEAVNTLYWYLIPPTQHLLLWHWKKGFSDKKPEKSDNSSDEKPEKSDNSSDEKPEKSDNNPDEMPPLLTIPHEDIFLDILKKSLYIHNFYIPDIIYEQSSSLNKLRQIINEYLEKEILTLDLNNLPLKRLPERVRNDIKRVFILKNTIPGHVATIANRVNHCEFINNNNLIYTTSRKATLYNITDKTRIFFSVANIIGILCDQVENSIYLITKDADLYKIDLKDPSPSAIKIDTFTDISLNDAPKVYMYTLENYFLMVFQDSSTLQTNIRFINKKDRKTAKAVVISEKEMLTFSHFDGQTLLLDFISSGAATPTDFQKYSLDIPINSSNLEIILDNKKQKYGTAFLFGHSNKYNQFILAGTMELTIKTGSYEIIALPFPANISNAGAIKIYNTNQDGDKIFFVTTSGTTPNKNSIFLWDLGSFESVFDSLQSKKLFSLNLEKSYEESKETDNLEVSRPTTKPPIPQPRLWHQKYRLPLIVGAGFATLAITSIMYHYFKSKR